MDRLIGVRCRTLIERGHGLAVEHGDDLEPATAAVHLLGLQPVEETEPDQVVGIAAHPPVGVGLVDENGEKTQGQQTLNHALKDLAQNPDPRLAQIILDCLDGSDTVLNVGAGAGSYEPEDRWVMALEPSTRNARSPCHSAAAPPPAAPAERIACELLRSSACTAASGSRARASQ